MFNWKNQTRECAGTAFFRGSIPPLLENFAQLQTNEFVVKPLVSDDPIVLWSANVEHRQWGRAKLVCRRRFLPVPASIVKFDPRLSEEDRRAATMAGSAVSVMMNGAKQNVLGDRKLLLRFLRTLLGDDGLIATDHSAMKFWPRESLDHELSHDADLDIDSLFITHSVYEDAAVSTDANVAPPRSGRRTYWAHTHGLAELGSLDFDILNPSPVLLGSGYDTFRAIAFLLLEEKVGPKTDRFGVVIPRGDVSFVPVEEFNRYGPANERKLREDPSDPVHNQKRVILCDPRKKGLLEKLLPQRPKASKFLSELSDDHMMAVFTSGATDLMAERARKTFSVFEQLTNEFADLQVKPLVKLGYSVDGSPPGSTDRREHLWFEVNSLGNKTISATLLNTPFNIARLKAGDRREHDLDLLTDWTIYTPAGQITPREASVARVLRRDRDKILSLLAQQTEKK